MAAQGSILGNAVTRKEDPGLLTGSNAYVDDLDIDSVRIVFVRSTMAHASLLEVDTSEAINMPGVLAVYTADNLNMDAVNQSEFMDPSMNRPPLAVDRVRFVGDIIAAVIAESQSQAADAAEQIIIDYDPLPANADIEAALEEGTDILWEGAESNVCFAIGNEYDGPDVNEGADTVVSERIVTQRLAGVPMEPNGCVAIPEGDSMTFYASTQAAHGLRDGLAPSIGLEPDNLRVIAPWVGGGFGPKAGLYIEFILCAKAAQELNRPVKWTEQRGENMLSMAQGRAMVMNAELGVNNDGSIVGLKARVVADAGAYPAIGAILPMLTMQLSQAVYDIPAIDFFAQSVVTNTTFIGAYRGAGRPEATQMVERILDKAANAIGMDPAELRRKNYLQPEAFPLTTLVGANYDSGEYERSLDAVLEASGYADLRAEQKRRRESDDPMLLGIGVSSYVEVTAPIGLHVEYGSCEINDDGSATIKVGTSSHGQGHDTAFSMIVNDVLGIAMDEVTHIDADTEEVARGAGTMGSRSLQAGGSAIYEASQVVLEKGKQLAASLLEASAEDIVVGEGALQVAGVPAKSISWADLASAAVEQEIEGGLAHELDLVLRLILMGLTRPTRSVHMWQS